MKRTEDSLRDLWDNIKCTSIWIIEVPEEEKNKVYEKIFEEITVENFPKHRKGNSQSSPIDTKSPIQDKLKEKHTKTLNKLTKTKYKERILKAAREKQLVTDKANPICLTVDLSAETADQKGMAEYIYSTEREKSTTRITVPSKDLIQNWWRNKKLFRQAKVKRIQYH